MNNVTFERTVEKEIIRIGDIIKITVGKTSDFYIVAAVSTGGKLGVVLISLTDGTCWDHVMYFEDNRFDAVTMCHLEEKLMDGKSFTFEKLRNLNILLLDKEVE